MNIKLFSSLVMFSLILSCSSNSKPPEDKPETSSEQSKSVVQEEQKDSSISLDLIPKAVIANVPHRFPNATIISAKTYKSEDNRNYYRLNLQDGAQYYQIIYDELGNFSGLEE